MSSYFIALKREVIFRVCVCAIEWAQRKRSNELYIRAESMAAVKNNRLLVRWGLRKKTDPVDIYYEIINAHSSGSLYDYESYMIISNAEEVQETAHDLLELADGGVEPIMVPTKTWNLMLANTGLRGQKLNDLVEDRDAWMSA